MPYGCRPRVAGLLVLLAACDLPTAPPKWETAWLAPLAELEVPITAFLPAAVSVTEDRSEFRVAFREVAFGATLRELCGACAPLDGTRSARPGFAGGVWGVVPLPLDVVSIAVTEGHLVLELTNGFTFDPIRSDGHPPGRIVATVASGGTTLVADTIDGAREAFPAGAVLRREVALRPGTLSSRIEVSVTIESPPGGPVEIDADGIFGVRVLPFELGATEAVVRFGEREVSTAPIALDFGGVTEDFTSRARGGALILAIDNPFRVAGTLALELASPRGTVVDTLEVVPGAIAHRLDLTAEDLRMLFGSRGIGVSARGALASETGTVALRPTQSVRFASRFEVRFGPESP